MLFAAVLGVVGLAQVVPSHMTIYLAGNPVGESVFSQSADGSFTGHQSLKVGATELSGTIRGSFKDGRLLTLHVITKGPGGTGALDYSDGKLTATKDGKATPVPGGPLMGPYSGNFYPALWSSTLAEAEKELAAHPTDSSATVRSLLIDVGAALPITFHGMPDRPVLMGGVVRPTRRFRANLSTVQLEIVETPDHQVVGEDIPGQKIRFVADGWAGAFEDTASKYPELSQPTMKTTFASNVRVKLRDGVELATDITRPEGDGPFPTILVRTPYGRGGSDGDGEFYAKRGYVYISQDVRGRGDSEGAWDPFVHEGDDGYDAIGWIAAQPWSDGKVGMIGGSYLGSVQWAAAVKKPPALKCIVPQVSPPDAMHNLPYEYGVPYLYADIWWGSVVSSKTINSGQVLGALPHPEKLNTLPLGKADQAVLGFTVPFYQNWITRTTSKDWKGWDFLDHMDQSDIPALHVSGWYDGDGIGTKLNWTAQRDLGRQNQWLIEGPWSHMFNETSSIGKLDFGPTAVIDLDSLYVRWFDTWLKGKSVGLDAVPKVQAFITGANQWKALKDWPDPSEQTTTLFLAHGALVGAAPTASSETYVYDPSKDNDTSSLSKGAGGAMEAFTGELKELEGPARKYLKFVSDPFLSNTVVCGPATVDLNFKTSAKDTDFFAILFDVDEKGKAYLMGESGKIRASYRNGVDHVEYLKPGETYSVRITPWDFAHELKKGHRLGLGLTSSAFPMFARNLGTDEPIATGTKMVVQKNTVLFGGASASKVTFHILP